MARATFTSQSELTGFLGSFYGWVGGIALLVQALIAARLIAAAGIAWSPDGAMIAFAYSFRENAPLAVFDYQSGKRFVQIQAHTTRNKPLVRWSRDGKVLAHVTRDNRIAFLNPKTGKVTKRAAIPTPKCDISPDMKTVAFLSTNTIRLAVSDPSVPMLV